MLRGSVGPPEASPGENGVLASSYGSHECPSTALTSSTVEIDFLLHFCRFTKI